jgi:hypothetical protein
MDPKSKIRTLIHFLTPETNSWHACLRTTRIWFYCGMTYGVLASFYVAFKIPMQPQAMISLSLFVIFYAGLKAALVGTLLWGLFALCARIRARYRQ